MSSQNLYKLFSTNPVEYNMDSLKAKLSIALVEVIRERKWNQCKAAYHLQTTQPRISNLVQGRLERFTIDSILKMWVCAGYKIDLDFDPLDHKCPITVYLKRSSL